ncbi:hypothetical protein NX059_005077 [Plenodomus lindquistii]|nr:hypothetical protein NX059_005077 [Plenodomus lindquistii]
MSISGDSTVAPSRDLDGSNQSVDGETYGIEGLVISSPDRSPYANAQIVSLEVGLHATRFDVHGTILQQSAELAAKFDPWSLKKLPVPLPEIDEATAHTLIHYLYTGSYQALGSQGHSEKAIAINYKLGTCAYCAAIRYKLPGLIELAREKITGFGEDVGIFEILAVAKDHAFPMLPEDELWYPEYVASAIKSAMVDDPEPFKRPDFIMKVEGNSRLLQVVWKTVMSSYAPTPVAAIEVDDGAVTPTAERVPDTKALVEPQEEESTTEDRILVDEAENVGRPISTTAIIEAEEPVPSDPVATHVDDMQDDTFKLDEIEPTDAMPQAPESFTDELGYGSSKMYQQMGKKIEQVTDTAAPIIKELAHPVHARSDSVIEVEEAVSSPGVEKKSGSKDEVADALEEMQQLPNGNGEGSPVPKKTKKSKKKKGTTFT